MVNTIIAGMFELFTFFLIGAFLAQKKILKKESIGDFSNFVIKILYTCYIFYVIVTDLNVDRLKSIPYLPLLGAFILGFGGLIGFAAQYGLKNPTLDLKKSFRAICVANNYGFLPVILVGKLWGAEAVANLFIIHLGCHFVMWTFAVSMLGTGSLKDTIKHLVNPNIMAIVVALIFKFSNFDQMIPNVVLELVHSIGVGAVPIILILIGANLFFSAKSLKGNLYNLSYISFIRLILIPLILVGIFTVLRHFGLPDDIYNMCIIISFMPSSSIISVITRVYGGDADYAAQTALVTHILALVTVPLAMYIFLV